MTIKELQPVSPANYFYDVRDQLKRHIYTRSEAAFARGDALRDQIRSRPALAQHQRAIRRGFLKSIGGLPPSGASLNARITGVVKGAGFKIEKVIFESREKTFVTTNLYLPEGMAGPRGAVLFVCGHHGEAKHVAEYQIVCQTLVRAGLIVLAQDPIGQGERFSYYDAARKTTVIGGSVPEHEYAGVQCLPLGDTCTRYFLHDAMRSIDYLCTRAEVDPQRIGITGNSGGGLQSAMMMLADPRIAATAPGTFIMNRETYMWTGGAQDAEQIWPGFTAAGFDHEDILLAMCPKPVRVLAVVSDFFPIEGTRRTVERSQRLWKLCGQAAHLDLVEDQSTHKYTTVLARAAAEFFARHLLGKKLGQPALPVAALKPAKLWCTRSGQVRGEIPGARAVHEANLERLAEVRAVRKKRSPKEALAWLRRRVFSQRTPGPMNPRFYLKESCGELSAEFALWWSQEGLMNNAVLFRAQAHKDRRLPVTLAIWDGGTTVVNTHAAWIRSQCRSGRAVLMLEVTGTGSILPNSLHLHPVQGPFGVIHKCTDDLLWLDDDLASLRTFDVIRSLDLIAQWPCLDGRDIRGYAHGRHGLYLQLAAALDRRIRRVDVVGGIGSFEKLVRSRYYNTFDIKSVLLHGVLQYFDLPELATMGKNR